VLHEPSGPALIEAARLLRQGSGAILLGSNALTAPGLRAAGRVAAVTGCRVLTETLPSRQEGGRHVPRFPALPYFPEQAREALKGITSLVLAGAREPIAFFGYPDQPSRFTPDQAALHTIADPDTGADAALALEALASELDAPAAIPRPAAAQEFVSSGQPLSPDSLSRAIAACLPEAAIVINESGTTGFAWSTAHAWNAAPHTMLGLTGGAIGQGLPVSLGAALACPDRRVIAFQADGSALYTLQTLWSMARESADVTVVVCANRRYRILQIEARRAGMVVLRPEVQALTEMTRPVIDWTALAKGFGVPACSAHTDDELADALRRALAERGPSLIEAALA
jgi:acetolactate synthase-1/2/3 large subunit